MARLFTTGFELGVLNEHNGGSSAPGTTLAVVTSPVRTGVYSLQMNPFMYTSPVYFTHVLPTAVSELYFRVAVLHTGIPNTFLELQDQNGVAHLSLTIMTPTYQIKASGGGGDWECVGTSILSANRWYVIEGYVKIDNVSGQVILKVNSSTEATYSGDTCNSAIASVKVIKFFQATRGFDATNIFLDDIAFNDTNGTYQNSWVGPGGVYLLRPNADGAQRDWTPSAGTAHWSLVDEVPMGTADWVQAQLSGYLDLYEFTDLPTPMYAVSLVQPCWCVALSQAGANNIKGVLRHGTVNYEDAAAQTVVTVHPNYVLHKGDIYYVDPSDSLAWTPAEVNALQVGVKIP